MRTSFAVLALSAVASVSAQRKVFTAADINVNNIPLNTKASWCTGERNVCQVLCDPQPTTNDCNSETLVYSCICPNGSAPGLEYYTQTMPTFICTQAADDCILANVGDARGQKNCTDSIRSQCGTIDAQKEFAASSSTAATASATGAATGTSGSGSSQTTSPSSASSSAYAAPTAAPARYGNAAAVAAIGLLAYMI